MKNKVLHIILFILTLEGYAQPLTSWNYTSTKYKHEILLTNLTLTIDGRNQAVSDSDAVAIFVLKKNIYVSAGYSLYNPLRDTVKFEANLDSGVYDPPHKFFFWDSRRDCQLEMPDPTGIPLSAPGYSVISAMAGSTKSLQYVKNSFTTRDSVSPVSGADFPVTYSCSNSNLVLDTKTGAISPSRSLPGTYTIKFNTDYCLKNDSLQITILPDFVPVTDTLKIDLANLSPDILPATCEHEGSVFIKSDSIKGKRPFTFNLTNKTDYSGLINSSGVFGEVKEGIYSLSVSDSAGNIATYPLTITIYKAGDCANTVLRPDGKDGFQSLYIPDMGHAKILNRNGELVKQLSIPAEWDCNDSRGKPVPMADYYLFINELHSKVITVLR